MVLSLPRQQTAACLSIAILILAAGCNNSSPTTEATQPPAAASSTPSNSTPASRSGGNTIEANGIRVEFVPAPEASQTHIDVFVQKGNTREPIPAAKLNVQVQTPNGQTQTVAMKYDAAGKHFAGVVSGNIKGQYQVKISAIVDGKTVDGRFSFDR
jgi:hypothetical protein